MEFRFEKEHNIDGHPVVDKFTGKVLSKSEIIHKLNEYNALVTEANIYLDINEYTNIASGSILHQQIKELAE